MALLKTALEEPLLSRQQAVVLRDIARAAQMGQGLIEVKRLKDLMSVEAFKANQQEVTSIVNYLEHEIQRVLMQIKLPQLKDVDHLATKRTGESQ